MKLSVPERERGGGNTFQNVNGVLRVEIKFKIEGGECQERRQKVIGKETLIDIL